MLNLEYRTLYPAMGRSRPVNFGERIQLILALEKMSQAAFARAIGVSRATVREWLSTRSKAPRPEVLFEIEDKFGYSARWLATGEEPMMALQIDATATLILESWSRLTPAAKSAVQDFIDFHLSRS